MVCRCFAYCDLELADMLVVGLLQLDKRQASLLGAATALEYGSNDSYVGVLEVFHQIHCLVSRIALYSGLPD